ncbi:MAG: hypothetical protein IIA60_06300 [Candidatus Marinimicrobia bacterium]|nr:hypothetical protein [Candidatus Neomarinimicrobiota bacterium]
MADNIVILARPHPFIARHMKKFLEEHGYRPLPIKALSELDAVPAGEVKAAVISTSLVSDVEESYADVFNQIRSKFPDLPVLFATLGNPDDMIGPIAHSLASVDLKPNVLEVKLESVADRRLGQADTFILVHKNCLTTDKGIDMLTKMFKAHLGV